MTKFRQLFSFQQKEVDKTLKAASKRGSILGLRLLFMPEKIDHGKILIIIPRSSGKANKRNLARRRIKSIFFEEQLYKSPGFWILIVYKEGVEMDFNDLKSFMIKNIK